LEIIARIFKEPLAATWNTRDGKYDGEEVERQRAY